MKKRQLDILTPQGYLSEIMDNPNLDVVMNLFRIPRAFSVSGFGDWNVGQHCFCVAYLALYWAGHRGYGSERRGRLVLMGLTHDLHESATGDILPALKTGELRERLEDIQRSFLEGLGVEEHEDLAADLKVLDIIAFMFEIRQAATVDKEQENRLTGFFQEQKKRLLGYCREHQIDGVEEFLKNVGLAEPGR